MLTELCQELHNWFVKEQHDGNFTISGGVLTAPFLVSGQYYRIIGSIFNDGVHKYGDNKDTLIDETFDGAVWALAIPQAVINLAAEIAEWQTKYGVAGAAAMSPFNSESFGGYSYNKGSTAATSGAVSGASWQNAFASRLNMWRKL